MEKERIVITGLGAVTPIGTNVQAFWDAAVQGTNGIFPIECIDVTDYKTKTGGEVRDFRAEEYLTSEEIARMGRSSRFAVAATKMALADARLDLADENPFRVSVSVGTTMGEPQILNRGIRLKYKESSAGAIPPELPRQYPCGVIPANIARKFNAKGPNIIIPTACAAGNYAIGYAMDCIRLGRADVVIAGGSDPFSGIAFTGFNRLLATTPDLCRPFDKNRQGMAVAEGAGIVIIESLAHAQRRNAPIYADLLGYGLGCDAFKMTIPDPQGGGGIIALRKALHHAGTSPDEIDYICAHGTGTKENDKSETVIAKEVFGQRAYSVPMSSVKSMIGHTMGAASAIEAIACILMMKHSVILPTINYSEKDPDCDLDYVPNEARPAELNTVVSNAYAFAGNTSAIVLRKFKG